MTSILSEEKQDKIGYKNKKTAQWRFFYDK
jgi:hypothetical protein